MRSNFFLGVLFVCVGGPNVFCANRRVAQSASTGTEADYAVAVDPKKSQTSARFMDTKMRIWTLKVITKNLGEPAGFPLAITAYVEGPDSSLPLQIVRDLRVCGWDGVVYNASLHALYFLLREKDETDQCRRRFARKFSL